MTPYRGSLLRFPLLLAMVAAFALTTGISAQESKLGHFKCYQTLGESVDQVVGTQDQFDIAEQTGFETTYVRQAFRFCNAVAKTHRNRFFDIPDRRAHLTMYLAVPTDITASRIVRIANQFGKTRIRTFSSPVLATPTMKNNEGFPEELDHYKCYRAYGRSANTVVSLKDQFTEQRHKVGEPILFCNPTRKEHGGVFTGVRNATEHLVCYAISREPFERTVVALDQFGTQTRRVRDADLLCAPTLKLAWERVQ
jgi:hypothetical protein